MKKVITFLAIFIAIIGAGCSTNQDTSSSDESMVIPVSAQAVEYKELTKTEEFFGKVGASEDTQVSSKTGGLVKKSYVALGDYVTDDQLLIELDDEDARYSLKQAEQGYQSAIYNLEQAKAGRETNILNAENSLELAEDTYINAKDNYEKSLKLYEKEAITEAQLKQAKTAYLQSENNLEMAKNAVSNAYSEANIKSLEAQVEQAKIRVDQARSVLDNTKIYSPTSGYIVMLNAEEGQMIPPQSPFIEIVSLGKVTVELNVNQSSITIFETGKQVDVYIPALGKRYSGKVIYVAPAANKQTLAFPVKVEVFDDESKVLPGMLAEVQVDVSPLSTYIQVPTGSVLGTAEENYVFVYKDGIAEKRVIKVKEMTTEFTYLEKGISSGELVITKGQHTLTDGAIVKLVEEEGSQ